MIFYTQNIEESLIKYIKEKGYEQVIVLTDSNTNTCCLPLFGTLCEKPVLEIPAGEKHKNIKTVTQLWESLLKHQIHRHALFINLGGGVVSDLGGFCASTYKRGIDFINIPTTVLAMVDATVGGKLGFNLGHSKNMVGLFKTPEDIFIDYRFLKTLSREEKLNGLAEALKHGLLFDMNYFFQITDMLLEEKEPNWDEIIQPSIHFKQRIVEEDYKESGKRKLLNFGHSIGHALESYFLEQERELKHGFAVVMGMIAALKLSQLYFNFNNNLLKEITKRLSEIYSLNMFKDFEEKSILNFMRQDKKNHHEAIYMVLLKAPESGVYDIRISDENISKSLDFLKNISLPKQ